ncbi:hypothetical protein BFF78_19290 [Streptomyces fodineus]|uniref:ABM domain-containing protein n=1 Tax=Streptomyces fodineus TaxID=1904616 RepID=A0A1D7YBF5_9ACTN|nr:hypothetical protein BFF78_19290 [Streptomyces fodineus]
MRDLSRPFTVIHRFTVKGNTEKFEREFQDYADYLLHVPGFDFLVTVRLLDRPEVYTHLGHWRSLHSFVSAVHDEPYLDRVRRLGAMVETEADQAVSIARTVLGEARVGEDSVLLLRIQVHGDWRTVESAFGVLAAELARRPGHGGSDLLRSTLHARRYQALLWWRDGASCAATLRSGIVQEFAARVAPAAVVEVERTRHLAYRPQSPLD